MSRRDPLWLRATLVAIGASFLLATIGLPLSTVIVQAFDKGWAGYWHALTAPETLQAVRLTLIVSSASVVANTIFGVAAAWLLGHFQFRGRGLIVALLDLPLAISPVVAGLLFVLLFGQKGVFGAWLEARQIQILFAVPGIVIATTFVTFPLVVREVLPLVESLGSVEEEAALTLGASGWQTFWRVSLPKIRWGLIYGVILCNARAVGEFGAVSVVSGHIRGRTTTLPLEIEMLYNEYNFVGAFAAASLLMLVALIALLGKKLAESRRERVA